MRPIILLSPLLAGVSVSAYSELLRGAVQPPRRLNGGGGACNDDGDCNNNAQCRNNVCGSCDGEWSGPNCGVSSDCNGNGSFEPSDGSCSCDTGYYGSSCDHETDYNVVGVAVVVDDTLRSMEVCPDAVGVLVDHMIDDWSKKELRRLPHTVEAECGDHPVLSTMEKMVREEHPVRYLKSSSSEKRDVVVTGVGFSGGLKRDVGLCFDEINKAIEDIEDGWSQAQLDDLDGVVIMLGPNEKCTHKSIERKLEKLVTSSSRSSSR